MVEVVHCNNHVPKMVEVVHCKGRVPESTPRGGVNRCTANLMTNDTELKLNCNTLSVTKECSRIPSEGLWTNSSKFL